MEYELTHKWRGFQIAGATQNRGEKINSCWWQSSWFSFHLQGKRWQWYLKAKAQVVGDLLLIFSTSSLAISYLRKGKSHNSTSEIKKFNLTFVLLLFNYDIFNKLKKQMHFSNMLFIYKFKKLMKAVTPSTWLPIYSFFSLGMSGLNFYLSAPYFFLYYSDV